ncbi:MAG: hypothetical protein IJU76_13045 [Desulfovibrionaceae bacterium]|nr:hypothetical protein [Desulfovibrionaceae bacterium]
MKKILSILSVAAIICSLSLGQAIAMESMPGNMKSDKTMMNNGMKKDGAMEKDHKMMDEMKKDGMMKNDGMKDDKGMMKDDSMKKQM